MPDPTGWFIERLGFSTSSATRNFRIVALGERIALLTDRAGMLADRAAVPADRVTAPAADRVAAAAADRAAALAAPAAPIAPQPTSAGEMSNVRRVQVVFMGLLRQEMCREAVHHPV
jgi:hypothetical protein